jgi:molybdopterin-biosynthesis enzyme MoeA-like protein
MVGAVSGGLKIIAVGDELLEGRTADTNSGRIQRALGGHALRCELIQVVPDEEGAIRRALDRTAPGDLVFLTGGLGSTPDDLTRDALAAWAGVPLDVDAMVRAELEERWRRRGVHTRPGVERQCQVPRGLVDADEPRGLGARARRPPAGTRVRVCCRACPRSWKACCRWWSRGSRARVRCRGRAPP